MKICCFSTAHLVRGRSGLALYDFDTGKSCRFSSVERLMFLACVDCCAGFCTFHHGHPMASSMFMP